MASTTKFLPSARCDGDSRRDGKTVCHGPPDRTARGGYAVACLTAAALLFAVPALSAESSQAKSQANSIADAVDINAIFEVEWSVETSGRTQKLEGTFQPELRIDMPKGLRFTAIGRARGDVADKLTPGQPSQDEISRESKRAYIGDHGEAELRELYLQGDIGPAMFTAGKQQIVWGQADGLKVLDVVNPQDLREFILDDFDSSRIPLWALNVEVPVGNVTAQLLWIPDLTYDDLPDTGAAFALTTPRFIPQVPGVLTEADKPGKVFEDSDLGLRLSTFWDGWDLTLNYLYHYRDLPTIFKSTAGGTTILTPKYNRSHLIGGTMSNAFGSFTVRGEVGFETETNVLTNDAADPDGVANTGELAYVLGLDWNGLQDTLLSVQMFQSWLTDYSSDFVRPQLDTTATFLARHTMMHRRLTAEVMWFQNVNDGDGLVRPKISFEPWDSTRVWLGADVFYGDKDGLFGQFDDRDRVSMGLQLSF